MMAWPTAERLTAQTHLPDACLLVAVDGPRRRLEDWAEGSRVKQSLVVLSMTGWGWLRGLVMTLMVPHPSQP
jgi:hypothetical protein